MIALLIGVSAIPSFARVYSLSGGLETGFDFDRWNYKNTAQNGNTSAARQNKDYNRFVTTPSLDFTSKGVKDSLDLKYSLGVKYDMDRKNTSYDHHLSFSAQRLLVQNWQINISDLYVNTDETNLTSNSAASSTTGSTGDTGSTGTSGVDQVSNDYGRHRFWTNASSLKTNYVYHQDSLISLGYTYSVLRNENTALTNYQDYDKHDVAASVSYRFNPEWNTSLGGDYIRGLYPTQDQTQTSSTAKSDLNEYHGNAALEYDLSTHNTFFLSYGYIGARYDDTTFNKDSDIHQGQMSWKSKISQHLNSELGGGPSYIKQQDQDGKWGYNAHARLNYALEHGSVGLGAEKGYKLDNFSGANTGAGYIDYWSVKGDVSYQVFEDLSSNLFVSYRNEDHQGNLAVIAGNATDTTNSDTYTKKIYTAGINVKYSILQWLSTSIGYTFTRQEADSTTIDQYDEHRLFLTLSANKEFWQW